MPGSGPAIPGERGAVPAIRAWSRIDWEWDRLGRSRTELPGEDGALFTLSCPGFLPLRLFHFGSHSGPRTSFWKFWLVSAIHRA